MRLNSGEQLVVLALLGGFSVSVIVLHAGEVVVLACRVRCWLLALLAIGTFGAVSAGSALWVSGQLRAGVGLPDGLALVGVQLAVAVCLPSRLLRWRKGQCERMRLGQQSRMGNSHLPALSAMRQGVNRPRTLGERLRGR